VNIFFLDINTTIPILITMYIDYKKSIIWMMLAINLMLAPVSLWHNGNWVLCIGDACGDCRGGGVSFAPLESHCPKVEDVCRKSCEPISQILDTTPDECSCCVEIPISTYIQENTPLSRTNDSSGGVQNVLAQSLPDSHPLLNKALFSPSPNPHIISTQKALRSVILIV
jgi:hypothetical protein